VISNNFFLKYFSIISPKTDQTKENMTTRIHAYLANTKGVYAPPIGHENMRISIVYIPEAFDRVRIGKYIGKDGKHLIRMTQESGVDYLWYESESHWFEIWSKDEISTVHAHHLLEQHWQQLTENQNYGSLIIEPSRIAVLPNYPQITIETMQTVILPHLLSISDYLPSLKKLIYNTQRNFYEIWSYEETTTQVTMSILHDILTSVSVIPFFIPPPPPVYFARTLDTHDFEEWERMIEEGQTPEASFFLRSSLS
jgi:hypothetical protein